MTEITPSMVTHVLRETGKIVAIKFLPRGSLIQSYVEREILNHKTLRHPHVIQFKEVFLTSKYLAIVMEYADQGDLFHYVRVRHYPWGWPHDMGVISG